MRKLLLIFVSAIFFISCKVDGGNSENISRKLSDSLTKVSSENDYLKLLLSIGYRPSLHKDIPPIDDAYEVTDTAFLNPVKIFSKADTRKQLVIRYTAIGCNSCTDELFKTLNRTPELSKRYDILVLASYSDYMYFLKWYKIAEVNCKVLFLSKGKIPNDLENDNTSYAFVLDRGKVSSMFIPNSLFPDQTKVYFKSLLM
ncbi:MAG: hypothetical protein BGO21_07245 [Dyadobacter sp. 50-39]|uniref:hypothetical protein n=1 Tax=Dyadobacter sp. 50-39 TaxID=1895756 RepID=UPI00096290B8|nr:hypothetical protein [Dyadobacter sp. 50-39]OJV17168.1 MAG: hypothetical protein BGO21_07245 [Dyadobacter sp. 50-39]